MICCSFKGVVADQVSCEKIVNDYWVIGTWRTCYIGKTSEISSADTKIVSRDESVERLDFSGNGKIKFLPIEVDEKIPNMIYFSAGRCSLTKISKANFKGLSKLRVLYLSYNKIEMIGSDVFEDLIALEEVFLGEFKFHCFPSHQH